MREAGATCSGELRKRRDGRGVRTGVPDAVAECRCHQTVRIYAARMPSLLGSLVRPGRRPLLGMRPDGASVEK